MLRNFLKNKKAQNTAEYALLIALVVAGVIAMQTYAQRALQARIEGASQYLEGQTSSIGNSTQYEPYYLNSDYSVNTNSSDSKILGSATVAEESTKETSRNGIESSSFSTSQ